MKIILSFLLLFTAILSSQAEVVDSSYTTQAVTIPGDSYTLDFAIYWNSADYPITSTPGRVELFNSQNQLVAWAEGNVTNSGPTTQTNLGSLSVISSSMTIMAIDLSVADGEFYGRWNITGVTPGNYTFRFWNFETQPGLIYSNTVWTQTFYQYGFAPPPATFTLNTSAGPGGSVTPGGQHAANSWTTITATADGAHDFTGWSGDASGALNPLTLQMTANRNVQANFTIKTYVLNTNAGTGGSVTPGGTYPYGTNVTLSAVSDATYQFAGWSGDASGTLNPLTLQMTANRNVQANFTINTYALNTYAGTGGSVTPGGTYPHGTNVTLSASPDTTHQFVGWIGAVNSTALTITLMMDGPKSVQALFNTKLTQTIDFPAVTSVPVSETSSLIATSSSGLTVNFSVVSGPGLIIGNALVLNGPEPVTIEATQSGSSTYLAAPPITRTVQAITIATMRYQSAPRTLLQNTQTLNSANYILSSQP